MKYDWLIVGSGLSGSIFGHEAKKRGKSCLVIDKRDHIAGNCYTEKIENIDVHKFGPHLFNTNNEEIWNYVQRFSKFNQYNHKVKVNYHNKIYSFPINLDTIYQIYGTKTPEEARQAIKQDCIYKENQDNMEDWCLANIGSQLYEIFVKNYSQKQWGKSPKNLPASIIKRIPVRFTYDDRYHQSKFCGIPVDGYTQLIANILDGIKIELGVNFFHLDWTKIADRVYFTGPIDALFNYCFGELEYRTLRFEHKTLDGDYQGVGQMNYTDDTVDFTRIIEHKHFNNKNQEKTVVTWEYPENWQKESEPYYPINDKKNNALYQKYKALLTPDITGAGRLLQYKYMDMDACAAQALHLSKTILS